MAADTPIPEEGVASCDLCGRTDDHPHDWAFEFGDVDRDRFVDEHGIRHRHHVPGEGQFQLRSACEGCDELYDRTVVS